MQYLYFLTISKLTVGIGTLLVFLAPVLVALWFRFGRKHAVSNRIWLAIALTIDRPRHGGAGVAGHDPRTPSA